MTQAGVPQDIIARLDKAALDKELREYEKAHQVWTKEVAPYSQMYDRLVADTRDSDQLTFNLPDRRYLTATYSGSPQTYYVGGSKGDGAESFVGPLWRLEIPKPGFHLFADPEIDVSLAIRRDDSGNVTLYRVDGPGRVAKVPLAGDVRSFAAILGIDLRADAVPPGS
jgi:hypothetical protein